MNCKFCNAQLEEDAKVCLQCGMSVAAQPEQQAEIVEETVHEEALQMPELTMDEDGKPELTEEAPAKKKPKVWAIVLAAVAGVALLGVLVVAVLYGTGIDVFSPKKETAYDVQLKDSYTITDEAAGKKAADTVVAVAGGVELTNSELQVYYWQTITDYINNYYYVLDYFGLDTSAPLDEQVYDQETGLTWQQFFLDNAIQSWHRYTVLGLQADEAGFTLDQEAREYLEGIPAEMEAMAGHYGFTDTEAMLAKDISPACTMDGYMRYVSANLKGMEYFESIYDTMNPTRQEIEAYYAANEQQFALDGVTKDSSGRYVDVRHVLLCPKEELLDAEGNPTYDDNGYPLYTDASWETCRAEAQALLDTWLAEDGTEDGFAKMAAEKTEDPGSAGTGGLYTQVAQGDMVPAFDAWCFDAARKSGDSGLVKTEYGYHIMYFVDFEEIWVSTVREQLLAERAAAIVEAGLERWPMVVDYKKVVLGDSVE